MLISYDLVDRVIVDDKQMYLHLTRLMAAPMYWCNAAYINWQRGSGALLEVTWRHHWASIHSVSSQRLKGTANKTAIKKCTLVVLMAVAVRRYDTKHIARWRGSRATTDVTGWPLWASIAADSWPSDKIFWCFPTFFIIDRLKRGLGWHQGP